MQSTERRKISQTEGHYGVEMVLAIREHVAEANPEDTSDRSIPNTIFTNELLSVMGGCSRCTVAHILNRQLQFVCNHCFQHGRPRPAYQRAVRLSMHNAVQMGKRNMCPRPLHLGCVALLGDEATARKLNALVNEQNG